MKEHEDHHVPITMEPLVLEGMLYTVDGAVYLGESFQGAIEKHFLGFYCKGNITWHNIRVTVEVLSDVPVLDQWLSEDDD